MTAQDLYIRRESLAEISGNELHELFTSVCGDPSPSGRTPIERHALQEYAASQRALYDAHKAAGGVGGEYLLDVVKFCEQF